MSKIFKHLVKIMLHRILTKLINIQNFLYLKVIKTKILRNSNNSMYKLYFIIQIRECLELIFNGIMINSLYLSLGSRIQNLIFL